jgi:predicted ATPase
MSPAHPITALGISGFKSIASLRALPLHRLNVLIGANGTGKSNFVSYFRMLGEMVEGRLQHWVSNQGSADRIVSFGVKQTGSLDSIIELGQHSYRFRLEPAVDGSFGFLEEQLASADKLTDLGSGHKESKLRDAAVGGSAAAEVAKVADDCHTAIAAWKVYHFHDTSDTAGVKRFGALEDSDYLRQDAANLAAFLHRLQSQEPDAYQQIRQTVQLALPFFDDFVLKPRTLPSGDEQIRLLWRQRDNDYALWPSQLSDGSIRFICLATALMQPVPPSTIIIDEPELGLHPYAITLLGALLRSASQRMQVIVSTQSVQLVNEFSIDDLIVVEREQGQSVFRRLDESDFTTWLEDYSVGELWEKNILGGRPRK